MRTETRRPPAPRTAPHRRYFPVPAEDAPAAPPPGLLRRLYAGEPATCRRDARQFLATMAQLGILVAIARVYHLEHRAFRIILSVASAALPIHYLLPYRAKKPFFIAASVVGLFAVLGPAVGATVLAAAALLIGACYLPASWWARAAAVAGLGGAMALARAGVLPTGPLPDAAWPMLGAMFMFRMILFLYELKHAKAPESPLDALAYFFLLPNFCFVHFPVVDYRTMKLGYFAAEVHTTQRTGLDMIFRGVVHLLLYRLVDHELLIPADEVHSLGTLAGFLACNYLLYLRVSGEFHVACGLLHLFGYKLPETHHNYLLATSFTDYWRRINIYWKDFMVRLVFNPVAFRLKRRPQWQALAAATAAVFAATWALHAYQSFWIRGTWGLSAQDGLFWGVLGVLVLVNVQVDARSTRRRATPGVAPSAAALARRSLRTAATFATIAVLWSLWTSPGVADWAGMWRRAFSS